MAEEKTYTVEQAHYFFALEFHTKTWELLEKAERSKAEDTHMLDFAHASLAHWRSIGTATRHKRGEWLVSRVYAVLGNGAEALKHAILSYEVFERNKNEMDDFDGAFVYEAIARAYAVSGQKTEALKFIGLAKKSAESIREKDDRDVFLAEFNSGEWYGVK
ncbi:MAG: hypothetical protein CVU44_00330 [Chloroflexi bacterium HGW-Chloroflexi-6]|nr:MAG: hypothetical protein CVU44_00330 [Chloroflexi bacterium HGW-Chloroflexi-6]